MLDKTGWKRGFCRWERLLRGWVGTEQQWYLQFISGCQSHGSLLIRSVKPFLNSFNLLSLEMSRTNGGLNFPQLIKVFLFQNLLTYRVSKAAGRGRCHRPRWCSRTSWPWHCRRWVPAGRRSHRLWSLGPGCPKRNWESWSCESGCWDSRDCRPGLRRTRHKKLQIYEVKTLLSPDWNPVDSNAFLCFQIFQNISWLNSI